MGIYFIKADIAFEYAIIKAREGYGISFSKEEIIDFLSYCESEMEKEELKISKGELSVAYNSMASFRYESFFDTFSEGRENNPLYVLNYNLKLNDIKQFGNCTSRNHTGINDVRSVIPENYSAKVRKIILSYLSKKDKEKNKLNNISDTEKAYIVAFVTKIINRVYEHYLAETLLAGNYKRRFITKDNEYSYYDFTSFELPESVKKEFDNLYAILYTKLVAIYRENENALISSNKDSFLARRNFEILFKDNLELMNEIFGDNFELDLQSSTINVADRDDISMVGYSGNILKIGYNLKLKDIYNPHIRKYTK